MGENQLEIRKFSGKGFTLVEVMIALVIVIAATVPLLQSLDLAFRHYGLARSRWKATVELWNRIELLRATSSPHGEPILILPNSRPLYRFVVQDSRFIGQSGWEVLIAEK